MKLYSTTLGLILAALAAVLGAYAFTAESSAEQVNSVTLPLHIYADGSEPSGQYVYSYTINASAGGSAADLYLKAHRIAYKSYRGFNVAKASIRVNGGSWVDVTDATTSCTNNNAGFVSGRWFGSRSNDCVDQAIPVIAFEMSASTLGGFQDGANTIDFRFNYAFPSDGPTSVGSPSSSYSILDLELRNSGGSDLIDGTTFTWDDPGSWAPPAGFDNASDISAGETLFQQRNILSGPHHVGSNIEASCADCHASDGRDLQYFAYSNQSIINRAEFHNLTTSQGKQIAAYIRSIDLCDVDDGHCYDPPARPWTPVYQPGPTSLASRSETDSRTAGTAIHNMPSNGSQYWAAGAGYDWALASFEEGLPYLFPNGITNERFEVDRDQNPEFKMWDIPVTLMYADWNTWLPHLHPRDIFGNEWETKTRDGNRNVWQVYHDESYNSGYHAFVNCWSNSGGSPSQCMSDAKIYFDRIGRAANKWATGHSSSWVESDANNISQWDEKAERGAQIVKWASVKTWEVAHTYDLADEADHAAAGDTDQLQWIMSSGRQPFDIAPHIVKAYTGDSPNTGNPWTSYLNTMWYDVNAVINHGKGQSMGITPNDWKYQMQFIPSGNVVQYLKSSMKVQEICDSYEGFRFGYTAKVPAMWHNRTAHCDFGTRYIWRDGRWDEIENVQGGLLGQVLEAAFRSQVETMMFKYSPTSGGEFNFVDVDAEWQRENGSHGWEKEDENPSLSHVWYHDRLTPSRYLKSLDYMQALNVKPTLLDSAAHWLDAMNPSSKWDDYKCTGNGGPLDCSKPSLLTYNDPFGDPSSGGDGGDDGGSTPGTPPPSGVTNTAPTGVGVAGIYPSGGNTTFGGSAEIPSGDAIDIRCSGFNNDDNPDMSSAEFFVDGVSVGVDNSLTQVSDTKWTGRLSGYTLSGTGDREISCSMTNSEGTKQTDFAYSFSVIQESLPPLAERGVPPGDQEHVKRAGDNGFRETQPNNLFSTTPGGRTLAQMKGSFLRDSMRVATTDSVDSYLSVVVDSVEAEDTYSISVGNGLTIQYDSLAENAGMDVGVYQDLSDSAPAGCWAFIFPPGIDARAKYARAYCRATSGGPVTQSDRVEVLLPATVNIHNTTSGYLVVEVEGNRLDSLEVSTLGLPPKAPVRIGCQMYAADGGGDEMGKCALGGNLYYEQRRTP